VWSKKVPHVAPWYADALYSTGTTVTGAVYDGDAFTNSVPGDNPLKMGLYGVVMPALPQTAADAARAPLFIMSTYTDTLAIATIVDAWIFPFMTSITNAPRLQANIIGLGFTFPFDGATTLQLPQPVPGLELDSGDTFPGFHSYGVSMSRTYTMTVQC